MLARCRELGIVTAAFYVLGFFEDTPESIAATIDYSIELGSTVAQFKILTPYPGTPLFKRMEPLITETGLGTVRRLHADVHASDAVARQS